MPHSFPYAFPIFKKANLTESASGSLRSKGGGVYYDTSIYYYWYRALQLSEKYKDCCKKKGNVKNKALKQVYKDFGNVFGKDKFEIWWKKNGNRLFGAEQDDIVREYTDGQSLDNKIAISIPLSLTQRNIKRQVNTILKKALKPKRGRKSRDQIIPALYTPQTDRVKSCHIALELYVLRKDAFTKETPNWKLGHYMNNEFPKGYYSNVTLTDKQANSKSQTADIKAKMNTKVSRHLRTARNLIANVEKGIFSEKEL